MFLVTLARCDMAATSELAQEYYVSPDGSDRNDGGLDSPWQTVGYALRQLSPGDVLNLRGGTYYEHGINVDLNGTASAPITIQSYPGERATIDGGLPDFRSAPNSAWELVDGEVQLYRTRKTFQEQFDFVGAWLVNDDLQLVEYESGENLESTNYGPLNGMEPFYMGPGIQLRADGHIYIRLTYNRHDLTDAEGKPIAATPTDTNPNNNSLAVFFSDQIFTLGGTSYLHFKDLDFAHARYILDVRNGSHHITMSRCGLNYGNRGLVLRDGVHDWEIYECEFNNGVPPYVYWTDVKNRDHEVAEAYPEFQSAAISGSMPGFYIHHNLFRDSFDGLTVDSGTNGARIMENVFKEVQDDSLNLSAGIGNVEVAYNMLWHVMSGISNLSSDAARGQVYIHHNVIDNSAYRRGGRLGNYREDNWPVWKTGSPFPDHDRGNKASWWKLYNNTIVTSNDPGHQWSAAGPDSVTGNPEKYVLNNIFYVLDERVIFRDDLASFGSHYDGNVVYRSAVEGLPLFSDFGDGGRYDTLQEFRANSGTDWEQQGLEIDPGFTHSLISDPTFAPLEIWERYRPKNARVFTSGASYDGLGWPDTENVDYRGALSASPDLSMLRPMTEDNWR